MDDNGVWCWVLIRVVMDVGMADDGVCMTFDIIMNDA